MTRYKALHYPGSTPQPIHAHVDGGEIILSRDMLTGTEGLAALAADNPMHHPQTARAVSTTSVAADLRTAADVLRRDGWTQGKLHAPDGCHCAVGALLAGITGNPAAEEVSGTEFERYDSAWNALRSYLHAPPPSWNDQAGRTADDVIATLEAAADAHDPMSPASPVSAP